ncbi:MAG TPA: glycosyltransferase [Actinophytocola sp.]|jgi:glycosyltransferase involved in cell wall biosynthesis|uniref:glycosyltransferase family 4 protein n=1 Tax=Actinophytocola sp. TaxID=1872138 RepID=UPI002DFDFD7F|nr:glycosyltransferase [Actinophytocola sp.]
MRCAMWSPLPPERSGIADYTYELLGPLAEVVDLVAVGRDGEAVAPEGVRVVTPDDAAGRLPVYQMGNHAGAHSWIYRRALAEPGLVVLHDTSLADFNRRFHGGIETDAFEAEVEYAHGPLRGDPSSPYLVAGYPALDAYGEQVLDTSIVTMERRIVTASRGVIVHDPHSAGRLRARYPGKPVFVVPQGISTLEPAGRDRRLALGWTDDDVVFGVFGGFNPTKRMVTAVLAFAQIRNRWPLARLVIAGHPDYPEVLAEVRELITRYRMADSVHLALSPGKQEFVELIAAVDTAINLRWPTAGETSAVMMRAFAAGKPVITSDLPQYWHLDPTFCWRVPIEPASEMESLIAVMERVVSWPEEARAAGRKGREVTAETSAWAVAAAGYRQALEAVASTGSARPVTAPAFGVNVFGDPRATTGLAESARRHAIALLDAGVDITFTEFNSQAPNRSGPVPTRLAALRAGKEFPIDLWLINLNEFHLIPESSTDRYTIALWAWELPNVLEYSVAQLPRIDELWVVSSFVAEAFRTVTAKPIHVIPNVVTQFGRVRPDRAQFGLPEDALVVLFSFSASSSDARKNPWGVVEAFRRAFPASERGSRAHLVIKATDLDAFPELRGDLAAAIDEVNGTLINTDLTRAQMDSLIASCDIYASLHRSEGFGMGMAEAMALGKAVVATGYGGNTDFMPPGSAAMVGYDIRPITERDHRYAEYFGHWYRVGHLWAEPRVDQAARWLRRLAASDELRKSIGAKAIEAVRSTCSSAAVGAVMRRRLTQIDPVRTAKAGGR